MKNQIFLFDTLSHISDFQASESEKKIKVKKGNRKLGIFDTANMVKEAFSDNPPVKFYSSDDKFFIIHLLQQLQQ